MLTRRVAKKALPLPPAHPLGLGGLRLLLRACPILAIMLALAGYQYVLLCGAAAPGHQILAKNGIITVKGETYENNSGFVD